MRCECSKNVHLRNGAFVAPSLIGADWQDNFRLGFESVHLFSLIPLLFQGELIHSLLSNILVLGEGSNITANACNRFQAWSMWLCLLSIVTGCTPDGKKKSTKFCITFVSACMHSTKQKYACLSWEAWFRHDPFSSGETGGGCLLPVMRVQIFIHSMADIVP